MLSMSPLPPPPGSTTQIHAEKALVLAPHFDDEVLGCGGLVLDLVAAGAEVAVLFLSDGGGDLEGDERLAYVERRRAEAQEAGSVLGVQEIRELGLRDGTLEQDPGRLSGELRRVLVELESDLILVPAPTERSADHRAAFDALHRLLGDRTEDALELTPRVLLYEVNHPLYPDVLVAVESQLERLEEAMACYASQLERHDYWQAGLGRRRFRAHTLPAGTGAVEAYRALEVADFKTLGPAALWRRLGASPELEPITEGPLISVIVRTKDRPQLLAEALSSLEASQYRRLEVLLVNDGGETPDVPADFPLPLQRIDLQPGRGRAGAANAGLAAASGDYVAFLDDDDRVEPEHYGTLVSLVGAAGVRVAYTDAAVVVLELDGEQGWRESERRLTYSRDFDADWLLFDNYIPFHTLLIERALAGEVGELDADLPFFEDWDWLIRLAQKTSFHHLPRVTCEYRQFRGGGHHILGDQGRERVDFLDMKARVIERHQELVDPARVARIVDRLRAEAVVAQEDVAGHRRELAQEAARYHRLNGTLRASEDRRRQLEALGEREAVEREKLEVRLDDRSRQVAALERQVAELHDDQKKRSDELQAAYAEIGRLGELIKAMESTRAWRLHQRLQGLKGS